MHGPDLSRKEMKEQADRIGKTLVRWASEASNGPFEPELNIRSPCENYLLTPMGLLRDALLPFRKFDEVLIPIDNQAARGIRHLEPSRAQFLTTLVTQSVTQVSVLAYAKALLAPDLPRTDTGGYSFQYEHGSILPAVLSGEGTPFHLLEYVPAKFDPSQKNILFDYEFSDYYTTPRPEIPAGSEVQVEDLRKFPSESAYPVVQNASLGLVPSTESIAETAAKPRIHRVGGVVTIGILSVVIPVHDARNER
ncbi:uncharacterized protein N7498_002971 [Penicillium cinerascens]|uniref:Uncharacterized protein n=1 Tax=Penicillium cinerascens TaxID=70096 RepID=A0A9W9NCT3_9EURO|nr:uncharacterized protein N7498_002971 [Penicillium cinerascens]KAJ5216564.1 hypothetical protein N7498_002971 [Penicillium cinerascens]